MVTKKFLCQEVAGWGMTVFSGITPLDVAVWIASEHYVSFMNGQDILTNWTLYGTWGSQILRLQCTDCDTT